MMRSLVLLLAVFFFALPAWGGELLLQNRALHNGEAAVIRWTGEPLSSGVLRFRDEVYFLSPDPNGAVALIPIGLNVKPGDYPLSAVLADLHGEAKLVELTLRVVHKERPQESLTLPESKVTPNAEDSARIAREHALLEERFALRSPRRWTSFQLPVDDPVSSVFGKRRLLNGKPKSPHSGTDFRSPRGTQVRAISSGQVVLAGDFFYTGLTVVLDHGEGLFSLYAHLEKILVEEGTHLLPGEILGLVGSTGRSTGAHLHLTVRLLGERIDPLALLELLST